MELKTLLQFDSIVIQCHNDPDADAIASGFGVWSYLRANKKEPRLVYGGRYPVRKSNLVRMVECLEIPVEHVHALEEEPELLLTVDCQPGERNVERLSGKNWRQSITISPERKVCPDCGTGRSAIITAPVRRLSGTCSGGSSLISKETGVWRSPCIMAFSWIRANFRRSAR